VARPAPAPAPLSDSVVATLVADVRKRRGVAKRDLPKVPPAHRAALDDAFRAAGLEVLRNAVRIPARAQLLALLDDGAAVDEKGLVKRLACVTGLEAKSLVTTLVREEVVRRVERPTGPALSSSAAPIFAPESATRLARDLEHALQWVRRVTRSPKRPRAELLAKDVADLLERLGALAPRGAHARSVTPVPSGAPSSLLERVTHAAVQLAAAHNGLAPVPLLVRAIDASTASVHAALLEGHARGWLELQPESSMGRLGTDDLALCPPGPEGTRLSWVRPIDRRP
jgi:hypothetical protein